MSKVEDLYTKWVYPIPVEDMRAAIEDGSYYEIGDPLQWWPMFWPNKRNSEKLDILVAGCGSVQAAYYACQNPNWNVLGIDISETSLAHQNKLKKKHNLSNLTLKKLSITDIDSLGQTFDFITCTGVLHHLPNPDAGLLALKKVLRSEGVINLMVYGMSLRLGVYIMQEVFRLLDFNQTQEDVDIVKATVSALSPDHVAKKYINNAPDLHYDAAFVDTFLHPQDRAYSVKEVFEFTRKAGLEFLSWADPMPYCLEAAVPPNHPLCKKIKNLPDELAAHICDLLVQDMGTHRWAAAHPDYVKKIQIPFETEALFDCIIFLHNRANLIRSTNSQTIDKIYLNRGNREIEIEPSIATILERSNSNTSLRDIVRSLNLSHEQEEKLKSHLNEVCKNLWKEGHIHILLP